MTRIVSCKCVGKHVPLPRMSYIKVINGEEYWLCPTTYYNLENYLEDETYKYPSLRKHYSDYVQMLARKIIEGV